MPSGSERGFEQRGQEGHPQVVLDLLMDVSPGRDGRTLYVPSMTFGRRG
jgi:hypothetical protein